MAVGRGGASSSATLAIAFLATGFVVCLLLAIFFFAQLGSERENVAEARADLQAFVSPGEANSPEVQARSTDSDQTVVGALLSDLQAREADVQALSSEAATLQRELENNQARVAELEAALTAEAERADAAAAGLAAARGQFDQAAQRIGSELSNTTASLSQVDGLASEKAQALTQQFIGERAELRGRIDELEATNSQLAANLEEIATQYEALSQRESEQAAKITEADAVVADVLEEGTKVALSIGSNDRVTKGLTFALFSNDRLVKLEDDRATPGKAVVEVFQLFPDTSVARVVERQRGARIAAGDAAVNLAFDKDRQLKFHVYGDFDIDNTGEPSPREQSRVRTLIQRFGGELADELNFDVDYLVLGIRPELPRELVNSEAADPLKIREFNEATNRYEAYNNLIAEAARFNIPVLNQNRFLDVVGYYRR